MTIAKPTSRPLIVGLLIVVALVVYAALSTRVVLAPSLPSITLHQQTQTETRGSSANGSDPAQSSRSSQSSQSSADTVQKPSGSEAPAGGAGSANGIQRIAGARPDVVGPAAAPTLQSCGPKPRPPAPGES